MISIINDDIAEPCKYVICTLHAVDAVRDIEPKRVTIEICDDDCEHMHVRIHTLKFYKIANDWYFLLFSFKH